MSVKNDFELFKDVRSPSLKGLFTVFDPQDIEDGYSPDMNNVMIDGSVIMPRKGSSLLASKPERETESSLQMMVANNSRGVEFLIVVYGNKFYLRDFEENRWILLNDTGIAPTQTTLYYGYVNWNNGLSDDTLYFGNGVDNSMKWPIALSHLSVNASSTDTSITLNDSVPFPSTGTLIIDDGANRVIKNYVSNVSNVLTLDGQVGETFGNGATVTLAVKDVAGIEKGKILVIHNRRLVVANAFRNEVKLAYSETNDPEDFTTGEEPTDGGILQINDGNGEITNLTDFGEFLLVEKQNNQMRFSIELTDDGVARYEIIRPLIGGTKMGPIDQRTSVKVSNSLYYLSTSKDIYRLSPTQTGNSSSFLVEELSMPINNYIGTLNFEGSKAVYHNQKLFWTFGTGEVITSILIYDLLRSGWTKVNGWLIDDLVVFNNKILFLERTTGNINECFVNYNDRDVAYGSYFFTKRYNFGKASVVKTLDKIYIEGYISEETELFVDVLYNEKGSLTVRKYKIDSLSSIPADMFGDLSTYPMAILPLGLGIEGEALKIFRCYLSVPNRFGIFNVQLKVHANKKGAIYGISGIGFNPEGEPIAPNGLELSPIN